MVSSCCRRLILRCLGRWNAEIRIEPMGGVLAPTESRSAVGHNALANRRRDVFMSRGFAAGEEFAAARRKHCRRGHFEQFSMLLHETEGASLVDTFLLVRAQCVAKKSGDPLANRCK